MRVVVIGGGPGGYVSAIRLAQLGAEVILVEKKYIGGTCLNVGCIPTKVLLYTSEVLSLLKNESTDIGIVGSFSIDFDKLQERKNKIVYQLVNGVKTLLQSNKIRIIMGSAEFINPNEIQVTKEDFTKERVVFDRAIIATGSYPTTPSIPGIESSGVITSNEALSLKKIPESLIIIGGGVIGCEFANIYSSLGSRVSIIEMLDNILPNMDKDIVNVLKSRFQKEGINLHTNSRVISIKTSSSLIEVEVEKYNKVFTLKGEKVLLAVGRRPAIESLGLDRAQISKEKGFIKTDKYMRTNQNHIYAIGDCKGGTLLAHTASAEGIVAAEHIMKKRTNIDFNTTPYCVYTKPELAGVGLTEKKAREYGYNVSTGIFPLYGNGKSIIMGEAYGLVKFVTDLNTGEILGLHIAGPRATDLIVEGALALRLEATIDEIVSTIHAHPTVGEAIYEAAHVVNNSAIHLPNKI